MKQARDYGIDSEFFYPYIAADQACKNTGNPLFKIKSFSSIPSNDMYELIRAIHKRPVTVAFWVSSKFQNYSNGIIDPSDSVMCPNNNKTNHAVVAVGYHLDINPSKSYILLKNSWSSSWGENGYFRFRLDNVQFTKGPCNMLIYGWKILSPVVA